MAAQPSQRMHAGCSWLLGVVEDPYRRLVGSRYQGRLDQSQTMWLSKIRCFFNFSFFFLNLWCVLLLSQMLFVWFYLRAGVCVSMWVMFSGTHRHTHTHIGFLNPDTKVQLFCWGLGWSAGFRAWKFVLGNVNLPFALWENLELEEKLWCFSVIF